MAVDRMVLCLAYKNQKIMDELKEIGFFEDLLEQYGIPAHSVKLP